MSSSDLSNTMQAERATHLVVLVHGLNGNADTMKYLKSTTEKQHDDKEKLVCYTATCNIGKTKDGIENGGRHLAQEVEEQMGKIEGAIALSFVGHSNGGLYARCALGHLKWTERITPRAFSTVATPHLGVSKETWFHFFFQKSVGKIMYPTIRDLLRQTPIISEMGTNTQYLAPLRRFEKRVAFVNAYKTDPFVPTASAAFLSPSSRTVHITLNHMKKKNGPYALSVKTTKVASLGFESNISENLDGLGWTKVFLDLRVLLPYRAIQNPFDQESDVDSSSPDASSNKLTRKPKELIDAFDRVGTHWKPPFAHGMVCASERVQSRKPRAEKARPLMDRLARDVLLC